MQVMQISRNVKGIRSVAGFTNGTMITVVVCNVNVFSSNSGSRYLLRQAPFMSSQEFLMVIRLAGDVELSQPPCSWPSGGCGVTGSAGKERLL